MVVDHHHHHPVHAQPQDSEELHDDENFYFYCCSETVMHLATMHQVTINMTEASIAHRLSQVYNKKSYY